LRRSDKGDATGVSSQGADWLITWRRQPLNSSESKGAGWRGKALRKGADDDNLFTEAADVKMLRLAVMRGIKKRWTIKMKREVMKITKKEKKVLQEKGSGLDV